MPLLTTKPTDHLFERFMKHQPNYKTDSPEADRIQETLDAEKERKEARPMIYRDERHLNISPQTGQPNGGNRSRVTVEMSPGVRLRVQAVE